MTNDERAARARQAFDASPHARDNNDETTNLYDLVCDLLHLADRVAITEIDHPGANPADTNGEYVARMGLWHYREELAEEEGYVEPPTRPQDAAGWEPIFSPWRHGGWYVDNLHYPSGAVGCVSRNYADRKWRIVCDPRPFEEQPTFPNRRAAALGERDLIAQMRKEETTCA